MKSREQLYDRTERSRAGIGAGIAGLTKEMTEDSVSTDLKGPLTNAMALSCTIMIINSLVYIGDAIREAAE